MYNTIIRNMEFTEKIIGHLRQPGEIKENYIPCVVYSKEVDSISFFLDKNIVLKMYTFIKKNRLLNYVFLINVEGKDYKVILREIQKDYLKDEVTHLDCLALNKNSITDLRVEVVFLNKGSSAVEKGHKMYYMNSPKTLAVRCIGDETISLIDVDLKNINSNTVLYSDQLDWPAFIKADAKKYKRIVLKAIPKKVVEAKETDKKAKKKK